MPKTPAACFVPWGGRSEGRPRPTNGTSPAVSGVGGGLGKNHPFEGCIRRCEAARLCGVVHGCGVVKAIGRARDWAEASGLGAGVRRALPLVGAGIATVGVAVVCQSLAARPVFADEAPQQGLVGQVTSSVLPATPSSSTVSSGDLLSRLGLMSPAGAPAPSGAPTVTGVVESLASALQPANGGSSSGVLGLGGTAAQSGSSRGDVLGSLLGGVTSLVATPSTGQPGPVVTGSTAPAPPPPGPAIYNSKLSSARAFAGATSDVPQGPPTAGVSTPSAPVAPLRIPQPGSPVAPTGGSLGALQTFGPGATVATFDVVPFVESRAPRRPHSGLRSWQSEAVIAIIERPG